MTSFRYNAGTRATPFPLGRETGLLVKSAPSKKDQTPGSLQKSAPSLQSRCGDEELGCHCTVGTSSFLHSDELESPHRIHRNRARHETAPTATENPVPQQFSRHHSPKRPTPPPGLAYRTRRHVNRLRSRSPRFQAQFSRAKRSAQHQELGVREYHRPFFFKVSVEAHQDKAALGEIGTSTNLGNGTQQSGG